MVVLKRKNRTCWLKRWQVTRYRAQLNTALSSAWSYQLISSTAHTQQCLCFTTHSPFQSQLPQTLIFFLIRCLVSLGIQGHISLVIFVYSQIRDSSANIQILVTKLALDPDLSYVLSYQWKVIAKTLLKTAPFHICNISDFTKEKQMH